MSLLSPLRRGGWRRWSVVLAGTVLLGSIPAVDRGAPGAGLHGQRGRAAGPHHGLGGQPYQGYAESTADFGLPSLPDLGNVSQLLDGTTDQYVWYRSAAYWRADVVPRRGRTTLTATAA